MKNIQNLMIKTIMSFVVLFLLIPVFGKGTWTQTLITGIVLVALSYVAGDLWLLPKFGNAVAIAADFVLAALVLWAMVRGLPQFRMSTTGIFSTALVLAVGEWLFHRYLLSTKAPESRS